MNLSTRARLALDELWAVRAECEKAVTTLMRHCYRHPREDDYRRATNLFEETAEMFGTSLDDFDGMTTLLAAEKAEREADGEPSWAAECGPGMRRREMEEA
jgi:hypothetical protein